MEMAKMLNALRIKNYATTIVGKLNGAGAIDSYKLRP
jgi:hypothetical protein